MSELTQTPPIVWITGAGGLIGHALCCRAACNSTPRELVPLRRADLDLLDISGIVERFQREKPAAVVHCAALSKNPACTANPDLAFDVNVLATQVLADMCSKAGSQLVFLSTDLVFDGQKGAYTESDAVNPLSVYAETKVLAEAVVLRHPRHLVLRLSLNGGRSPSGDRGFNEEICQAWAMGKVLDLFIDEFRCPMSANVTADAIWELVDRKASGLYHLCGSERVSRHRIGELLAMLHPGLSPQIVAGSIRDYKGPPRAPDTSMNCDKVEPLLSFRLPRFSEWLETHGCSEF